MLTGISHSQNPTHPPTGKDTLSDASNIRGKILVDACAQYGVGALLSELLHVFSLCSQKEKVLVLTLHFPGLVNNT